MSVDLSDERWSVVRHRGRLGIEPLDALRGAPPAPGVQVRLEQVPRPHEPLPSSFGFDRPDEDGFDLPGMRRTRSGRFAVGFDDRPSPLQVRLTSPDRRFVPRRIRVPVLTEGAADAEEEARDEPPFPALTPRLRRPAMFPGAAYGVQAGATGVQGRVVRPDGTPVRWARVVARPSGANLPELGWAHGDDRGEFLLVLRSTSAQLGTPPSPTVLVRVIVTAPPAPVTHDAAGPKDPLWDLPIQTLGPAGADDPVTQGVVDPAGYTDSVTRLVTCRRGRATRPVEPFVLT